VKIAFTASGNTLDARLDSRFGRAPSFIIYDPDHDTFEVVNSESGVNAGQGAGIQSAETIARLGVTGIVTGHLRPERVPGATRRRGHFLYDH
jgi:predicted Fe-Mo cluster-binding NifX family protein